ncbi:CBO0543 family protein [Anaerospora hongkongensis]|uniref:CBO0543 family protein n=1 Tax=Anaerospora hongkongensis TaxID=244830 RepID=UPI00289F1495|nr:CBO0543 family protein [Anaerospora hongkongensis]
MWLILVFRICLLTGFLVSVWKWGDWKNWKNYYPSVLFVMVVNLSVSYLGYHHSFWIFNPDVLVDTQTVVELLNTYISLPATTLLFLSYWPRQGWDRQGKYLALWVFLYGAIEGIDHYFIHGISYGNGWCYGYSLLFDCAMFTTIAVHYIRPFWGWIMTFTAVTSVVIAFKIFLSEMK